MSLSGRCVYVDDIEGSRVKWKENSRRENLATYCNLLWFLPEMREILLEIMCVAKIYLTM